MLLTFPDRSTHGESNALIQISTAVTARTELEFTQKQLFPDKKIQKMGTPRFISSGDSVRIVESCEEN